MVETSDKLLWCVCFSYVLFVCYNVLKNSLRDQRPISFLLRMSEGILYFVDLDKAKIRLYPLLCSGFVNCNSLHILETACSGLKFDKLNFKADLLCKDNLLVQDGRKYNKNIHSNHKLCINFLV